jgi:TetR/AcrR family transcriptional regulator, transcriptional repressor for nem operon
LEEQATQMSALLAAGGPEMAIDAYLSTTHRDNPSTGCASAALLPELARQPAESRRLFTERFVALVRQVSAALPSQAEDPEGVALGVYATLIGTLQLARAVEGTELSNRILEAGKEAARTLVAPRREDKLT